MEMDTVKNGLNKLKKEVFMLIKNSMKTLKM